MKALIIYDDFASAARANATLQHTARNLDFTVQWSVVPWRVDMLKCPPTAQEALTEALDAHLIVLAVRHAVALPAGVVPWLERWAVLRHTFDAALAMLGGGNADAHSPSTTPELSRFAERHGLSLVFGDGRGGESQPNFLERGLDKRVLLASPTLQPAMDVQIHHPHTCWGINE